MRQRRGLITGGAGLLRSQPLFMTPEFSVIIPTYARPDFLHEAVASVLQQTHQDFECIVVDDASPTPARVVDDPRVRVIYREQNRGPAAARNTGILAARGRCVAFLDDDDLFTPERLSMTLEARERSPVLICRRRFLDDSSAADRDLEGDVRDVILNAPVPHLGTVTLDRSIVPLFNETLFVAEDVEWFLRLAQQAAFTTVTRVGYLRRLHPAARHNMGVGAHIRDRMRLLELHERYFVAHPRAAARQWQRIGLMALRLGDLPLARRAHLKALRLAPTAKELWHVLRATGHSIAGHESASPLRDGP